MGVDLNKIESVSFVKMNQEVMRIIREHAKKDSELEKDLYALIELIDNERKKSEKIKELAYFVANLL
ncbi:hypothetical protein J41TS2_24390 [Bacillus sonorensis]|uniref:hypothetical protein n=1 Tax=Bacillus sonorensis TaxID=119858 RepID=UPI001B256748|nr:hypothetical protein [Bacillus sonorensis]GIN67018.1 hypothetical protein J41TS2_24390 [Bacillus sonorensis]